MRSAPAPEPGVVLITGASSGIGEAIALMLHQHGHVVYAGARRTDRMAALAEQGISTHPLDVTDDASTAAMAARSSGSPPVARTRGSGSATT